MTSSTFPSSMDALADMGIRPTLLSPEQRRTLDDDGYLVLEGLLSPAQVERLSARFDELVAEEGARAGTEFHQEAGASRLANLVDKDPLFDLLWCNPLQLAGISHVLGGHDFKLSSLNARAALPGAGAQPLHPDWLGAVPPGDYQVCNSIWLLDDFTPHNGATRVIPGSHRTGSLELLEGYDNAQPHRDEVLVQGKAGTCVVFNSHLLHGGTLNTTDLPRRACHAYFTRREHPQQTVQRDHLRPETVARLTPAQRHLLDLDPSAAWPSVVRSDD